VIERRIDPCMSEVFGWEEIPLAHMKMLRNQHKPGNMAVLVQATSPAATPSRIAARLTLE
jgi:crotonyl-CoA carboxylase/reductase